MGLFIGMNCCIPVVLYVADELSFDRFWLQGDRIYRIAPERKHPGRHSLKQIAAAHHFRLSLF